MRAVSLRTVDPGSVLLPAALAVAVPAVAVAAALRPATALVGAALLAFVAVCLLRIDVAVLLLVATGPLESAFSGNGLNITKTAGLLAFASFAVYLVRGNRRIVLEPLQGVVLAILGIALISAAQAQDYSVAAVTATRYASFVAIYIVISQVELTPAFQRRIAWVLGSAATASALLGLQAYFSGQQAVANLAFANPNDFGFMLATSLPLMFWLLGGRRLYIPILLVMIGIVFAAVVLSLSRGTLVGLVAGFLFFVLTDRRRLQLTLVAGLVATTAAVLVIHSNPQKFQNALTLKQHVAQENVTTRFEAWSIAARLASDNPLLGIGPGNFRLRFPQMAGLPPGVESLAVAHDAYLDVAAELGVIAALLFLVYLGVSFWRLTLVVREGVGLPGFGQALRVSLVVAMTCSIFLSEQYYMPFWLIGGLGTALLFAGNRTEPEPR